MRELADPVIWRWGAEREDRFADETLGAAPAGRAVIGLAACLAAANSGAAELLEEMAAQILDPGGQVIAVRALPTVVARLCHPSARAGDHDQPRSHGVAAARAGPDAQHAVHAADPRVHGVLSDTGR